MIRRAKRLGKKAAMRRISLPDFMLASVLLQRGEYVVLNPASVPVRGITKTMA